MRGDWQKHLVERVLVNASLAVSIILGFAFVAAVGFFFPSAYPFELFEFWLLRGGIGEVLSSSWPVFAWGAGVTIFVLLFTKNPYWHNKEAESWFAVGALSSALAGIFEEILFRWVGFFSAIITAKLANFLFFGWAGFGLVEWLYAHIGGPLANLVTLGRIEPLLFHPAGWFVGAGILSANAKFRDGHKYQGPIGLVNSWFIGLFMFWLMFEYGLPAAILVHFLYDLFIYMVRYVDMVVERALGRI